MSNRRPSSLPDDASRAIELLQAELAETNREVMMLTLEMDQRVEARTAEVKLAHQELEQTNADLRTLTLELEKRVDERTRALRESEERYRLAAEVLAKEARRKDEFLALLGHELRNPLAPIRTAIHLLQNAQTPDSTAARMHEIIGRQVGHLARLVDDLLDVSRISRGKIRLHNEIVDLVHLVRVIADDHRAGLESAGLTLSVRLPATPLCVRGDVTRLSQIVGNLLTNARKFTDAGGRVAIDVSAKDARAVLAVTDTGIGIEPEMLPTLFEPFSQSERGRSRSGGLGLGLALVKGLAELHEGSATASSAGAGKGARFTVTLPMTTAPVADTHATALTAPPAARRRILIVEDNRDAATTLALFLEKAGHVVVETPDAASGLEKAREFRPEIILCDIGLPGAMDGYGLAAAICADPALGHPFLVAITGFGQEDDKRRAHEAGFDVHLVKPVDPRRVELVLANAPSPGVKH
jgi:signal transduction histidine kinase/ActR/RegA family two-component response regulator